MALCSKIIFLQGASIGTIGSTFCCSLAQNCICCHKVSVFVYFLRCSSCNVLWCVPFVKCAIIDWGVWYCSSTSTYEMLGVSWVAAWNKLVLGNSMESHQPLILIRISLHPIQLLILPGIYGLLLCHFERRNMWTFHFATAHVQVWNAALACAVSFRNATFHPISFANL